MKSLAISLVLASFAPAAAAGTATNLGADAVAVSAIAGEVAAVRPLCPEGVTCIANGTVIDLRFTLAGCLDRLGPVSYKARKTDDGRLAVSVSAINIHDRRSMAAFCHPMPTATATITLINQYGEVDVDFLTTPAAVSAPRVAGQAVVVCREPVDHGATLTFRRGDDGEIGRAVYTETTFADTQVVADMGVCRQHAVEGGVADAYELTVSCNDTQWVNSYEVELYEGGFSGIPQAKIYKGPQDRELVKTLSCRYL